MCNEIEISLHSLLLAFSPQKYHRLVRPAPIGWHIGATGQRAQ
jgi:hypothetical protein